MQYKCVAKNALGYSDGSITLYGKYLLNMFRMQVIVERGSELSLSKKKSWLVIQTLLMTKK